jgi:hypothetical protein
VTVGTDARRNGPTPVEIGALDEEGHQIEQDDPGEQTQGQAEGEASPTESESGLVDPGSSLRVGECVFTHSGLARPDRDRQAGSIYPR